MQMTTRPYRHSDREHVVALLADGRAVDTPGLRVQVAEEAGAVVGAAVYRVSEGGGQDARLGAVVAADDSRIRMYALVRACALDAMREGHTHGSFTVRDRRLLDRLRRDFRVDPKPSAWEPSATTEPGAPVEWTVEVDLADAVGQLDAALARLGVA